MDKKDWQFRFPILI